MLGCLQKGRRTVPVDHHWILGQYDFRNGVADPTTNHRFRYQFTIRKQNHGESFSLIDMVVYVEEFGRTIATYTRACKSAKFQQVLSSDSREATRIVLGLGTMTITGDGQGRDKIFRWFSAPWEIIIVHPRFELNANAGGAKREVQIFVESSHYHGSCMGCFLFSDSGISQQIPDVDVMEMDYQPTFSGTKISIADSRKQEKDPLVKGSNSSSRNERDSQRILVGNRRNTDL